MAYLVALTPEGRQALPKSLLPLDELPLRFGRDLRWRSSLRFGAERRQGTTTGPNDIYLPDPGPRCRLSREHFLIGRNDAGFFLEDRDSTCGTWVGGKPVGGQRNGGRTELRDGDEILAGGRHSPWAFRFVDGSPPAE